MSINTVNVVGRTAFTVKCMAYWLGLKSLDNSLPLRAVAWAYAFYKAIMNKQSTALFIALMTFPRFRLGLGRKDADEITPFEHFFRLVAFRKVDVKFAPLPPLWKLVREFSKHGAFERHLQERELAQEMRSAYSFVLPLQRYDRSKPATLVTFVTDPDDVEQILTDREAFPTRGHTGFTEIVGEGLLGMKSGPMHTKHRQVVLGFLTDNHLRKFSTVVSEQIEVMLDKWGCAATNTSRSSRRINAQYDLSMLTLDIIMLTAFGASKEYLSQHIPEEENRLAHGLDEVLKDIVIRTVVPLYKYLPTPKRFEINGIIDEARNMRESLFAFAMNRVQTDPDASSTMLSEMIRMRKSNNADATGMSDMEIINELHTIRGAGHETTSNTLCWTMLLLARHPHVLERLRDEAERTVKGDTATFDEAREMKYHAQVVYETLRLYPTVPSFPRECHKDSVLKSGFDIPAGSLVFVSQSGLNRNPTLWENPNDFIPERFEGVGELQMGRPVGVPNGPRYGFCPFGAANRSCVGQRLAILEAVQILSSTVLRCDWKLAFPDKPISEVADITLGPKKGLIFDITPRIRERSCS